MIYLHLGGDTVVPEDDIIGIFDTDNTTQSHVTRDFLHRSEKRGEVVDISGELPKSFVLCAPKPRHSPGAGPRRTDGGIAEGDTGATVYLSQLASATLQKRSENGNITE